MISILKSSYKCPNSYLVTPFEIDFVSLVTISHCSRPILAFPLEYFLHNSAILGKGK
jgi:hypothetical protein